jgi:hypothetical protein
MVAGLCLICLLCFYAAGPLGLQKMFIYVNAGDNYTSLLLQGAVRLPVRSCGARELAWGSGVWLKNELEAK